MVYVLSKDGRPLMPTERYGKVKHLLRTGKAKVVKRCPFTIKLLYDTTTYTQPLTLGIDTGSGTFGAAVCDTNGKIVYASEVTVRNDITKTLDERRSYRRNRRNRKTRYRKARFNNRRNSIKNGRFSPTIRSKIQSHCKEIEFVKRLLPITKLVLETGIFDPHLLKNPLLALKQFKHWGYQQGPKYGYENTRAMVLERDNYLCQACHGKSNDTRLNVHHIVYRSNKGSDDQRNLITLCKKCHDKLHNGYLKLNLTGVAKGNLVHATQMNIIRKQLLKIYPGAIETFGYVTKANRQMLGLEKAHYIDASVIASAGTRPILPKEIYKKVCIPQGDFKKSQGVRSEQWLTTGKICGFRKYDKVLYNNKECFVKGRMSSGYAILMDITGKKICFNNAPKGMKTPKLANMQRLEARTSWMVKKEAVTQNTA